MAGQLYHRNQIIRTDTAVIYRIDRKIMLQTILQISLIQFVRRHSLTLALSPDSSGHTTSKTTANKSSAGAYENLPLDQSYSAKRYEPA